MQTSLLYTDTFTVLHNTEHHYIPLQLCSGRLTDCRRQTVSSCARCWPCPQRRGAGCRHHHTLPAGCTSWLAPLSACTDLDGKQYMYIHLAELFTQLHYCTTCVLVCVLCWVLIVRYHTKRKPSAHAHGAWLAG